MRNKSGLFLSEPTKSILLEVPDVDHTVRADISTTEKVKSVTSVILPAAHEDHNPSTITIQYNFPKFRRRANNKFIFPIGENIRDAIRAIKGEVE